MNRRFRWVACLLLAGGMLLSAQADEAEMPETDLPAQESVALETPSPALVSESKDWVATLSFALSKTAYEDFDISRQTVGLALEKRRVGFDGLNLWLDAGYALKAKHAHWSQEGSGFAAGLGSSLAPLESWPGLRGFLRLFYLSEDYGSAQGASAEGDAMGATLGVGYAHAFSEAFQARLGLDFLLFESGSYYRQPQFGERVKTDMKRDTLFGVALGATYCAGPVRILADLAWFSEQSLTIGLGIPF